MEAVQLSPRSSSTMPLLGGSTRQPGAFVLLGLLICGSVLIGGYFSPRWASEYGPGLDRIFQTPDSPIVTWLNTVLLFTAAQGAWAAGCERARGSSEPESGIWKWAAATWLLFSFSAATQAHLAWSETILFHIRWRSPGAALWCWLLPATAWGWGLFLRLEPQVRDHRPAHWLLIVAGVWYAAVAGLLCQLEFWPQALPRLLTRTLLAAVPAAGHASLLLSMTCYARFLLSDRADSGVAKKRSHMRIDPGAGGTSWLKPTWLFQARRTDAESEVDDADAPPKRGSRRATAARKRTQRKSTRTSKADEGAEEGDPAED